MAKRKAKPQSDTVIMTLDKSGRARRQVKFWLDATKPQQAAMGEALDTMRKDPTKNFAAFMRNAVSLMLSLMTGDISVLLMLFPGIVERIKADGRTEVENENARLKERIISLQAVIAESDDYIAELEAENDRLQRQPSATAQPSQDAIQAQLDRIERQLLAQGHKPIDNVSEADLPRAVGLRAVAPAAGNGMRTISAPQFSAPQYDDDDDGLLEVKRDSTAGMRATQNFLNSLMSLSEAPVQSDGSGLSARQRANLEGN